MWSVIGMAGWQYGSFATLLILARLQAINPKLYEAAARLGRRRPPLLSGTSPCPICAPR